jgi:hypothetical protein
LNGERDTGGYLKETIDIVGWLVTSLVIGAGVPAAGMWLMSVLNRATEKLSNPTEFTINYFVPYRDGQLGYVVLDGQWAQSWKSRNIFHSAQG